MRAKSSMLTYVVVFLLMFIIAPIARTRAAMAIFFLSAVFFISLRYETGFDWPVYKAVFEAFQGEFILGELASYQDTYSQELGFLLFTGVLAGLLPSYEVFQALISVIFLTSIWRLALASGAKNVALVFALVLSYLLLTVAFSTVRQSLAIALFNFGLIAILSSRRWLGAFLFMLSVTVQVSAALYIAALVVARLLISYNCAIQFRVMVVVAVCVFILFGGVFPMILEFLPFIGDRWSYYAGLFSDPPAIGRWDLFFIVMFIGISVHVSIYQRSLPRVSHRDMALSSMIVVLCGICVGTMFFPIIRDRASYLLWILYSILLAKSGLRYAWVGRFGSYLFGAVFSFLNVLSYPSQLAFVPYENVVICYFSGCTDSGGERQIELFEALDEILGKAL